MSNDTVIIIVMGVTGSGKSTIGAALATKLGWLFTDGDDLHPAANVAKMHAGHPLTDEDRAPWLAAIGRRMDEWAAQGRSGVIACSALKRAYRDALRGDRHDVKLVYLEVDRDTLVARLAARHGHFMPPTLLDSQLATLEPPMPGEHSITVEPHDNVSPAEIVQQIIDSL
jgi:gluconokinase